MLTNFSNLITVGLWGVVRSFAFTSSSSLHGALPHLRWPWWCVHVAPPCGYQLTRDGSHQEAGAGCVSLAHLGRLPWEDILDPGGPRREVHPRVQTQELGEAGAEAGSADWAREGVVVSWVRGHTLTRPDVASSSQVRVTHQRAWRRSAWGHQGCCHLRLEIKRDATNDSNISKHDVGAEGVPGSVLSWPRAWISPGTSSRFPITEAEEAGTVAAWSHTAGGTGRDVQSPSRACTAGGSRESPRPTEGLSYARSGCIRRWRVGLVTAWPPSPLSISGGHARVCVSLYLHQFISPEETALLSWHEKGQSFLAARTYLLSEPCLSCFALLIHGSHFSDIVNWMYLWMRIDPFEMFVFAFDVLLFMLVTARWLSKDGTNALSPGSMYLAVTSVSSVQNARSNPDQ